MQSKHRVHLLAALSTTLCFAAAPVQAQGLVSVGSGSYISPTNGDTSRFSYFLLDGGNGAADGYAAWRLSNSTIVVRVTSFGFLELTPGTTSLGFAGPIVAVYGTPSGPNAVVGRTAFAAFNDNGFHAADETTGFNVAPLPAQVLAGLAQAGLPPGLIAVIAAQIGDLTTIQQIAALLPFSPPPVWASLTHGNVRIR